MKKGTLSLFFTFIISCVYSQDFPDFGIPSSQETELTECPFEKEAGAVVLIHEAYSYSEDNLHLITSHHIRIKVLKQSGSSVANISIPFIRIFNYDRILDLQAVTLNRNEKGKLEAQKVNKKSIYTNKINDVFGEINFAFPSVVPGSIVEYQYKSIRQNYYGLQDWIFQREIPVLTSRYHLKMIPSKKFTYRMIQNPETETTLLPGPDNLFVEMRKIPSFPDEPYMDCESDYIQRINFRVDGFDSRWGSMQVGLLSSSWPLLNIRLLLNRNFGSQVVAPIPALKSYTDSVKELKDELIKMKSIYQFVRNNMSWNQHNAIFSDEITKVWENKSGSLGEINMLLINLLNKVQLKSYPLLISTRSNGKVDTTYPYSDQFNALFACVELKGKKYILDATDKYCSGSFPPAAVLNTLAFMVTRENGELITITEDAASFKEEIALDLEISNDAQLKGKAVIASHDYARIEKLKRIKADSVKMQDSYESEKKLPVKITSYSVSGAAEDTLAFTEQLAFTAALNNGSDYNFIPQQLFSGLTSNPFLAEKRYTDINFGFRQVYFVKGHIKCADKYLIESMPESTSLSFPELQLHFSRTGFISKENNSADFEIKIEIVKTKFEVSEYPALKNAFKSLFNKMAEQIALKRK